MSLTSTAPAPQPTGDLLGDDSAANVSEKSADIGNKKLQLENTSRGLSQLEKSKTDLQQQESTNAADLQTLERELASARSKHEAETKAVSDLRVRVGEQTAKLKQLRADVISAESDLNAMRMEKDELEQSFLRDKEEVRGLQKQIKELEDEKTGLKLLLDKVRKEARQQKGLVSIAKKQVSTAESGRDAVQAEVRDAEQALKDQETAAPVAVSSPHTPRALSPNATGASQRSTNPFERFRTPSAELSPAIVGASGALAGATLGGAVIASAAPDAPAMQSPAGGVQTGGNLQEQDPFGMPATGSVAPPAAGFDDSFGQEAPSITTDQAPTDFDSAFADFDNEATPIAPAAEDTTPVITEQTAPPGVATIQRPEPDRSVSTQAIPPSSLRSTPLPADEPSAEQSSPVDRADSSAAELEEQSAARGGDAESSDDDEGPEDVDGPRRPYATEHRSVSQEAVPSAESANADAEHPAARVRRHAPPPPTGRQSSRSDSFAPPVIEQQAPSGSALASGATDPFGAPVESTLRPSDPQPQSEVGNADFGESFDPLTASTGASAVQTSHTPDVPGAFPAHVDEAHNAPKASEFDDEDEFDFSDMPPAQPASQPGLTTNFDTTEQNQSTQFGQSSLSHQQQPQDQQAAQLEPFPQSQPEQQQHQHQQSPPTPQFTSPQVQQEQQQQQIPEHQAQMPSQQQQQQPAASAFDDEFANFDDDFGDFPSQPNSGSDNNSSMLRSYEVVGSDVKQPGEGGMDAWGMSNNSTAGQPAALSFDDAFGGDFSPVP